MDTTYVVPHISCRLIMPVGTLIEQSKERPAEPVTSKR